MSEPEIKFTERPKLTGPVDLPEPLTRYLEAKQLRPSWQWNDNRVMGGMYASFMSPFDVEQFRADDPEAYEITFVGKPGHKRLYINSANHVQSWDGILMVQPTDQWEEEQRQELELRNRQQGELTGPGGQELDSEALADAMRKLGIPASALTAPRSLHAMLAGPPGTPFGPPKEGETP